MPFLAPKRIVIVSDLLSSKPPKAVEKQLVAYLPALPDSTNLILLESSKIRDSHAVQKLAKQDSKLGFVKLFERPQGNQLNRWIEQAVAERNGAIAPRAIHALSAAAGNDLNALENEIEKLTLFKGEERITFEDVERLGAFSAESSIFDLVDAIGNRNGKRAVQLLQQQLTAGADPFYLFSMFIRQFRLLIQVRECVDQRMRQQEIAQTVGIHPFVAQKMSQQARSFSQPQLEKIYHHLLAIDVGVKTGANDMTTALNLLVASLAQ